VVRETGLVSDLGELRFKNPLGGPSIELNNEYRKIRRFGNIWVAGAGIVQWLFPAYRELEAKRVADVRAAAGVLRDFSAVLLPVLAQRYPEAVPEIKKGSSILFVQPNTANEYQCHSLDWRGYGAPDIGVFCALPFDDEKYGQDLMVRYEKQFDVEWYASGFHDVLRATATTFLEVYRKCGPDGTVSQLIEIGLSRRSRGGKHISQHLAPTPCETVMAASDAQLDKMLVTVT
jgi:hypothetical protein